MRVLLVEPLGDGGIAQYAWSLADHLAQTGAQLALLTRQRYEYAQRGTPYQRFELLFPSYARRGPTWFRRAVELVRALANNVMLVWIGLAYRPDVIHLQWPIPLCEVAALPLLRRLSCSALVFTAHNVVPHEPRRGEMASLQRLCTSAGAVITHGDALRLAAIERYYVDPARIHVINMGVHDSAFDPDQPSQVTARQNLGLQTDAPAVLFFGYIRPYKALDMLLDAFATVHQRLPDARLMIVGRAETDAFHGKLDVPEMVRQRGLVEATLLDLRYVALDEITGYYRAADIVVLPYTHASQSGVIQLAYAHERPVLVSATGSLAEVVQDGRTGFVVAPGDRAALTERLLHALLDRARLERMGIDARAVAIERFSWAASARATLRVYRQVLGSDIAA
jgi:glycosyltransferase involved in cell wall biosynthesis